jgi:phospholipid/cholesterol/gamma-HCH transport system substrate-binding protein
MSRLERLYSPPEIGAPGKRAARSRRRDLLLAGAFVVTMAAVAAAAVTLVMPGLFGGTYRLKTYFPDASGLTPGLEVVQNGYTIGMLESVRPVFPGRDPDAGHCPREDGVPAPHHNPCFRAALRIQGGWPITQGTRAQLGSSGLLQGKVIKLLAGTDADRLEDGAVIPSTASEPDLGGQLSALTDSIQSIVDETISPALASLEHQIRTIEGLLGTDGEDSGNRERLAGAFENLQRLTGDLEEAVDPGQIANILGSVEQLAGNLGQVSAELSERTGAVERAANEYNALAADIRTVLKRTSPPLERSLDDTQYLLQELSAALTPILANVEDATRNLSALSRDLRNNPAVIIRGREAKEDTPWFE